MQGFTLTDIMEQLNQNRHKRRRNLTETASLRSLYPEALLGDAERARASVRTSREYPSVSLFHSPALVLPPDGRPEAAHEPGGGRGSALWLAPWRWRVPEACLTQTRAKNVLMNLLKHVVNMNEW